MSDKPIWREVYDRVTGELGPRMIDLTGSDEFAGAVEVAGAVRNRAVTELQRSSRRVLHAWNLPAGSDIAMLRREIGALDREVRALTREVESLRHQLDAAGAVEETATRSGPQRSAS
jgi:hypothetical protein